MTDTSSDSMSRPPKLSSYTPPSEMSSAPSSAPLRSPLTPGGSHPSYPGPTSRPSSGVGAPQGHPYSLPPPTSPHAATYHQSQYYGMSNPQGIQLPSYQDVSHPHGSFIGGHDPTGNMSPGPQSQKRAYRQRRKDPSCDACRERKVKCDATDTTSCTECTSRSVRCQFTKDTNRRMTSLKHNQDLIKELARTKSELEQAKIEAENGSNSASRSLNGSATQLPGLDTDRVPSHGLSNLPGLEDSRQQDTEKQSQEPFPSHDQRPTKRRRTIGPYDFSKIGRNMSDYSRGIFRAPNSSFLNPTSGVKSPNLPELPPKDVADALLDTYHAIIHPTYPVLHWPKFQDQYDRVYQEGTLQNVPGIWTGLFFAVLALGALHQDRKRREMYDETPGPQNWKEAETYFEQSKSQIDMWTDNLSLDNARAALLVSMFLIELNMKSAGWTWLGIATRIAFDIGLHCEAVARPTIELEMCRRVWWCICSYDCLLSLEMGRPSMIKEQDFNVGIPRPINDQYIRPDDDQMLPTPEQPTSQLPSMVQTINSISKLHQVLKTPSLTPKVISTYEMHFTKLIDGLDAYQGTQLRDSFKSGGLPMFISLQNARLVLHRNNLAPSCDTDLRSRAIDNCALVAKETAKFLQRCMERPRPEAAVKSTGGLDTWKGDIAQAASVFFCTHLWRCTLFLCFRLDFHNALTCARASAALQDVRPVTAACGHYLEFYLKELISRLNQGLSFDTNEELIAYASGDLQGNLERSWVWQSNPASAPKADALESHASQHEVSHPEAESPVSGVLQGEKWQNWDWVLTTLGRLQREKEQQTSSTVYGRPGNVRRISPPDAERLRTMAQSPEGQAARERMRIKDLI